MATQLTSTGAVARRTNSYSSSITIEALDASLNVVQTLILRGGGLPHMGGASWGLDSSMSTTFYPGNPQDATQQFTVAKEIPSDWTGEWNLTRLNRTPCRFDPSGAGGSAQDVVSPGVLIDALEDMQLKGRLLRVTWSVGSSDDNVARTVTRLGRIARFRATYTRSVDVGWEIQFAWKSRGRTLGRVATTRQGNANDASAGVIAAQLALNDVVTQGALFSENPNINLSASQFTLGQLETLATGPLAALQGFTTSIGRITSQIGQVLGVVNALRALPYELADGVVGLARNTVEIWTQFDDLFSATPFEAYTLSDDVADLSHAVSYFSGAHDKGQATADAALAAIAQVRAAVAKARAAGQLPPQATSGSGYGGILAIYRTRAGDTPQRIALHFYGTADQDVAILRANKLPYYQPTFDPGTLLVIPVATTTPTGL